MLLAFPVSSGLIFQSKSTAQLFSIADSLVPIIF